MPKVKTIYVCNNCGAESAKWIGRCPSCGEWNSYSEEIISSSTSHKQISSSVKSRQPELIDNIKVDTKIRLSTTISELDRVLGGGIVMGSMVLLGGEPGIGKSTLALQMALSMKDTPILYISGEESEEQIGLRAKRLKNKNNQCYVVGETEVENIFSYADSIKPRLIIVDSIQTIASISVESSAGTISQVRECASLLLKYCKTSDTPIVLIGHITKDGAIAGPKILEHIVDVVLNFEGDNHNIYRIVRPTKNRFGSTSELGIFEMEESGLREVSNPSELFITQHEEPISGVAISATISGMRPLLVEVQSLVSSAVYGTPQRSTTGFDVRRLNMLLAVLEKRAGFKLAIKDVFLNIAGGIKVIDPAIDMALIAAILSSNLDIPILPNICFAGEVGLSGEIRPVSRIEQRIREADKMGFQKMYISKFYKKIDTKGLNIEIIKIGKVEHLIRSLLVCSPNNFQK